MNKILSGLPAALASRCACFTAFGNLFFKVSLGADIALRMMRARHQFAPAMPRQQRVNRAASGLMANGFFVRRLQLADGQQLSGACRFCEARD
jgi:hypothetical protein